MQDKTKLILKILGFAAIVLIMAWIIWALFFKSPSQGYIPGRTSQTEEQGQLPQTQEGPSGQILDTAQRPSTLVPEQTAEAAGPDIVASGGRTIAKQITPTRADFSTLASNGQFNYYDWRDEKFYRIAEGGQPALLSDDVFRSVDRVAWSNSGNSAILEFPDGSNIYYNFDTGQKATLPQEAQEFTFSPDDSQLAYEYIGASEDDRWIIASSPDNQGQQLIQPIGKESRNVKVDWSPNNQVIATYRNPTSSFGEEVFFIGFNEENYLSLQTNGIGFEGAWSPKGKQILYSVYSKSTNYNPVLHISGAEGDNIGLGNRPLNVQTWPDKCSFASEDIIYCAVPQYLNQGSGIFREQTQTVPDTIYKIDLVNNQSIPIAFPETETQSSFTIENIMISDNGSELYFTDRVSGRIHSIRLR